MLKKRIIPVLLLKNGRMVKGKKFSNFKDTGDPNTAVKIYSSQDADELMFLDINSSQSTREILLDTVRTAAKECNPINNPINQNFPCFRIIYSL